MNNEDKSISQIEQFHVLASLAPDKLQASYSEDLMNWLKEFIKLELTDVQLPSVNSPKEFAGAVLKLGDNKRAWSQRLSSLVIDLADSGTVEQTESALTRLQEFSEQCPWKFLRESANHKKR